MILDLLIINIKYISTITLEQIISSNYLNSLIKSCVTYSILCNDALINEGRKKSNIKVIIYLINFVDDIPDNLNYFFNADVIDCVLKKKPELINKCFYHQSYDLDLIKHLIGKGADIHANNDLLIRTACMYNREKVVDYLIDINGVYLSEEDYSSCIKNEDLIKIAVRNNNLNIVKCLIRSGIRCTPECFSIAFENTNDLEMIKELVENGGYKIETKYYSFIARQEDRNETYNYIIGKCDNFDYYIEENIKRKNQIKINKYKYLNNSSDESSSSSDDECSRYKYKKKKKCKYVKRRQCSRCHCGY